MKDQQCDSAGTLNIHKQAMQTNGAHHRSEWIQFEILLQFI